MNPFITGFSPMDRNAIVLRGRLQEIEHNGPRCGIGCSGTPTTAAPSPTIASSHTARTRLPDIHPRSPPARSTSGPSQRHDNRLETQRRVGSVTSLKPFPVRALAIATRNLSAQELSRRFAPRAPAWHSRDGFVSRNDRPCVAWGAVAPLPVARPTWRAYGLEPRDCARS